VTVKDVEGEFSPGQVFSSDSAANTAMAGMYRAWRDLYNSVASPTVLCGLSSDELKNYSQDPQFDQFYKNNINPNNSMLPWAGLYNIIYQANAFIQSAESSPHLSEAHKRYYTGEAKFIRAHSYFNLVNLFGAVPVLLTTDVKANSVQKRQDTGIVYQQIVADVLSADSLMDTEIFPVTQKGRLNQFVAKAFLARVYLFLGNWAEARRYSDFVIGNGEYQLSPDLDDVFIDGSREAIFQFENLRNEFNIEILAFIPTQAPGIVCTNSLIDAFETNDQRMEKWVSPYIYESVLYFYPAKYKPRELDRYTLFRLAEQLLIRAEANTHLGNFEAAVDDINLLRERAGIDVLNTSMNEDDCLEAIMNERRVELFAETGHRWFDLKRSQNLNMVMVIEKGNLWTSPDSLYPLPATDIQRNRQLVQNPGYN
jgi:hypothetical protein